MSTVTIAIPVYNGAQYLRQSIESAQRQTVPPDRLEVWDNASTDESVALAESLLAPEDVKRAQENLGAAANFQRAARAATTDWFMWLAADDRLDPSYVETCLRAVEASPTAPPAVLTGIRFIDAEGRTIRTQSDPDLGSQQLKVRARAYVRKSRWTEVYCLYRRSELEESPGMTREYGTDTLLTWWFILRSPLLVVKEPLFEYREATARTVEEMVAALMLSDAGAQWRKVRLFRRMWSMARAPDLSRIATWTARQELVRALGTTAAAHHLLEDLELRISCLERQQQGGLRTIRLVPLRLAARLVRSRARVSFGSLTPKPAL